RRCQRRLPGASINANLKVIRAKFRLTAHYQLKCAASQLKLGQSPGKSKLPAQIWRLASQN
ncbi:MAG: hypothetical protein ACKO96_44250, partial [Flammeovirgaceae bacterium]